MTLISQVKIALITLLCLNTYFYTNQNVFVINLPDLEVY